MALVQTSTLLRTENSGATSTLSYTSNLTAGSLSVLCVGNYPSGITSVSGSANGAYTQAVTYGDGGNNYVEIWYKANVSAGAETLTITPTSTSGNYVTAVAQEWSGMATSSPLDRTGTSGTLTVSTSAATTQANEVVFTVAVADAGSSNVNWGTPSGYTLIARENDSNTYTGLQAAYKIVAATGTQSATHTNSSVSADTIIATFKVAGSGAVTLAPPLITSTATTYAPSLIRGAVTISPGLLTNTSTLHAPSVSNAVTLSPPLIGSTATTYSPALSRGAVTLSPPLLANSSALYSPALSLGAVALSAPLIGSTSNLYAPALTQGWLSVSPPLLVNSAALYAPALTLGAVTISPPLIASTATTYAPAIATGAQIAPPLLVNSSAPYAPSLSLGAIGLTAPLIASTATTYAPSLAQGVKELTAPLIASTSATYPPSVSVGAVSLSAPLIASTAAIHAPAVANVMTVGAPLIVNTSTLYAPTVTPGGVPLVAGIIVNTSTLYAPALSGGADTPIPTDRVYMLAAEVRRYDATDGNRVWEVSKTLRTYEVRDE